MLLLIYISNSLRLIKKEIINRLRSTILILYQAYQNTLIKSLIFFSQNKDIEKYMIPIKRLDNKKLNMTMKLLILFYMFHSIIKIKLNVSIFLYL